MAPKVQKKKTKRTFKYLAQCRNPKVVSQILRKADRDLVKNICNATYNLAKGEVPLTNKQKRYFALHRGKVETLASPNVRLADKTRLIQKGSGAFAAVIPLVLGTVLSTLGSAIFKKKND